MGNFVTYYCRCSGEDKWFDLAGAFQELCRRNGRNEQPLQELSDDASSGQASDVEDAEAEPQDATCTLHPDDGDVDLQSSDVDSDTADVRRPRPHSDRTCCPRVCLLRARFVCMNYQNKDSNMDYIDKFFSENNRALVLKPENLRYVQVTIAEPKKQDPNLSYATRNVEADYYNFNI